MIAQYIIDWKCVRDRIDRAACVDDVALERLRGRLSALREKISENGVLIVDEDACLLNDLNTAKGVLESLISEDQPDCGAVYFDMKQELDSFLNAYENAGYMISAESTEDAVQACVSEWRAHTRRIFLQGIKGGVVITDRREDLDCGSLALESWERYGESATEAQRKEWQHGLSFNEQTRGEFLDCLNSFAATSRGDVLFVDKYWSSVGVLNVGGGMTTRQKRYVNSTMLVLKPFVNNPDISRVDFITVVPEYKNGEEQPCFCINCENGLCEKVRALAATRRGDLKINVMLVEPRLDSDAQFHNRYMINERFTVALHNGLDVCDRNGRLIDFQMSLFGATVGATKMASGHVVDHNVHAINTEEVDVCAPYVVSIKDNPKISVTLNG